MGDSSDIVGGTIGARVSWAAGLKGYTTAAALAEEVSRRGYSISRQSMANLWDDRVKNPRKELLKALEPIIGLTLEEMRYGPRPGDTEFLIAWRALETDLERGQRDQLLYLGNEMAKETRKRREEDAVRQSNLSADEAALLAAFRGADESQREGILEGVLSQAEQDAGRTTPRPGVQDRPRPRRRSG